MKRKFKVLLVSIVVLALVATYMPVLSLAKEAVNTKTFKAKTEDSQKAEYEDGKAIIMYKRLDKAAVATNSSVLSGIKIEDTVEFEDAKVESPMSAFATNNGKAQTEDILVSLVSSNKYSTEKLVDVLEKDSSIIYAEPNYKVKASAMTNDTYEAYQWAIENNGQNAGKADFDINPKKSANVDHERIVAIVDTGIDYNHPELSGIVWNNPFNKKALKGDHGYNFAYGTDDPLDDNGHGSHCAGIIAAASNNKAGITGAVMGNSSIKIMALKFLDSEGGGDLYGAIGAYNYIYKAQQLYAESDNNAEIVCVSNSWGGGGEEEEGILNEIIDLVGYNGALSVCAAGNEMTNTDELYNIPSCLNSEYIIAVAASNEKDELAYFSNYGAETVDIAAPGADILSTVSKNTFNPTIYTQTEKTNLVDTDHYYDFTNGTNNVTTNVTDGQVKTTNKTYFGKKASSNYSLAWSGTANEAENQKFMAIPYEVTEDTQHFSMMISASGKLVNPNDEAGFVGEYVVAYLPDDISEIDMSKFTYEDFGGWFSENEILYMGGTINSGNCWDHIETTGKKGGTIVIAFYSYTAGDFEINIDDMGYSKVGASEDDFGKYDFYNGTSMATPYVSAAVAVASCEYPEEDAYERKSRLLGSVRLSDDLKGKMVSPGVINLDKLDNPFPTIQNIWMDDDGTVYIQGKYLGTSPEVYVNDTKVTSNYNSDEGAITFDGTAYKNRYVEIKIKTEENEVVRNIYLTAGTPFEYETYTSVDPIYSMTTDGTNLYMYTRYNGLVKVGLNGTNVTYEDVVKAFGDDDWGGDDDDDDYIDYGDLTIEELSSASIRDIFQMVDGVTLDEGLVYLDSDLVYLNGKLYGIFSLDLGYTTEKVIASYSIQNDCWQKEANIPLDAFYSHQTLAVYNGNLYVIGGFNDDSNSYVTDVYMFDLNTNTFTKKESLPEGRGYSKAVQYGDKLVLVLGASSDGQIPETLVYNGNAWTKSKATLDAIDKSGEGIYLAGIGAIDKGVVITGCSIDGVGDTCLYDVKNDKYVDTEFSLGNNETVSAVAVGEKFYAIDGDFDSSLRSVYVGSNLKSLIVDGCINSGVLLYIGNFDELVTETFDKPFVSGTISKLVAIPENDYYTITEFSVNGKAAKKDENGFYVYEGLLTDDTNVVLKAKKNVGKTTINKDKVSQTKDSITVYWDEADGADGYKVYVYNTSTKKWDEKGSTTKKSYKITKLKAGTSYKIKVRGYALIDEDIFYGAYSDELSAVTAPATPKAKVTAGKKKATIKWGKISGASGYEVRMATKKNGTYKNIKTITKGSTVSFTKTKLTKGKTYYFKVRAYKTVNGKKIYSSYSSIVSAKIK